MDWKTLYSISGILDTETMGLDRGSGMHEAAFYSAKDDSLSQFIINPNYTISVPSKGKSDALKFVTSSRDIHLAHPALVEANQANINNWSLALRAQLLTKERLRKKDTTQVTLNEIRAMSDGEFLYRLKEEEPLIYEWLQESKGPEGKYPWLRDLNKPVDQQWSEKDLQDAVEKVGARTNKVTSTVISPSDLFKRGKGFVDALDNHVIWIANTQFESKQLGALLASQETELRKQYDNKLMSKADYHVAAKGLTDIRSILSETPTDIPDIFNVTGAKVNQARAIAFESGDWSPVFRAIMENTEVGDVRDILDVVRAQQSFSEKLGILEGRSPFNFGMDIQGRVYGVSVATNAEEAWKAATTKEMHAAWADARVTESSVLQNALRQTTALEEVYNRTDVGKTLIAEAKTGKGDLYHAVRAAAMHETLASTQVFSIFKNYARTLLEISQNGYSEQSSGTKMRSMERILKDGTSTAIPYAATERIKIETPDQLRTHLKNKNYVGVDIDFIHDIFMTDLKEKGFLNEKEQVVNRADFEEYLKTRINEHEDLATNVLKASYNAEKLESEVLARTQLKIKDLEKNIIKIDPFKGKEFSSLRSIGKLAGGMVAIGAIGALIGRRPDLEEENKSFRSASYERWLEHAPGELVSNNQFSFHGLPTGGINEQIRHTNTDFGSPYQGPVISDYVLRDQKLLKEREDYNRQAFGARHYDPMSDIGQYFMRFGFGKNGFSVGSFMANYAPHYVKYQTPEGEAIVDTTGYEGLKSGKQLLKVDLGLYNVTTEDADTVTLRKKGFMEKIKEFIGFGSSMSVRFAGIDAPETAHDDRAAQPLAGSSKTALEQMIKGNFELLVDPSNITYGRTVGFAFSDGKNLNMELLRRGHASYLPYGKSGDNVYNESSFNAASMSAQESQKQIWSQPYYQAYLGVIGNSKNSITFNTLVNPEKVAKNSSLMNTVALMGAAQSVGRYDTGLEMHAAEVGKTLRGNGNRDDFRQRERTEIHNSPRNAYTNNLGNEIGDLMNHHGKPKPFSLSRKSGYGELEREMSLDTVGTSTSAYSKRRSSAWDTYGLDKRLRRKQDSAALQRMQNHKMFNSPINHQRM